VDIYNLCAGSIDKKILGPSFRAIASKYKQETQTQSMLATAIQKGGTGKWGQMPMPPIPSLNAEQASALAKFVLEQ